MLQAIDDLLQQVQPVDTVDLAAYYRASSPLSRAFLINLETNEPRRISASNVLARAGVNFTLFRAIKGSDWMRPPWTDWFPKHTPGQLGCLLSHMCIYRYASAHRDQDGYTLVFEDDILSNMNDLGELIERIERVAAEHLHPADIIHLGKCFEICGEIRQLEGNIWRAFEPWCTHAYMIRNSLATRILSDMNKAPQNYNLPIDVILSDYYTHDRGLVIHPAAFVQDVATPSHMHGDFFEQPQCSVDRQPRDPRFPRKRKRSWTMAIPAIACLLLFIAVLYLT